MPSSIEVPPKELNIPLLPPLPPLILVVPLPLHPPPDDPELLARQARARLAAGYSRNETLETLETLETHDRETCHSATVKTAVPSHPHARAVMTTTAGALTFAKPASQKKDASKKKMGRWSEARLEIFTCPLTGERFACGNWTNDKGVVENG